MASVSLILPLAPGSLLTAEAIEKFRKCLEGAGHTVDVLGIADPRSPHLPLVAGSWWRSLVASEPGLASASVAGLRRAKGDVLVVLDHDRGYTLEDLTGVIEPIERHDADLVVASRNASRGSEVRPGRVAAWAGLAARRVLGSTDPFSGLLAITRDLARSAELEPLGSCFTLELLARAGGQRQDLAVGRGRGTTRRRVQIDDIRHLKRLGDHKFGNISRLIQFCVVGASGMVVDLSCYALFQWLFSRTNLAAMTAPVVGGSLALAMAGACSIALALIWNFSLNRRLTFSYARHGSLFHQFFGYVLSNALGVALSFSLRLILPRQFSFFNRHRLAAALVGIVAATGISFTMARWFVFGRRSVSPVELQPQDEDEENLGETTLAVAEGAEPAHLSSFEPS
ncbi:GtrA family protein [Singulisphaera acidiphila]|uniref:Putative membrane protein n=1 Tax=Singulisphaera acidiphila (strain ATCC BAA-1392 / DSM 18658 / VKM B-2454 / MOB10) TaxID=886293 RepID=L0DJ58_SINAD|nr:GtrA family protein [Singulisphaera acidiphila]AGA29312.1 putative membrane protein [Singulisphaera acidiphila DSM 18658]